MIKLDITVDKEVVREAVRSAIGDGYPSETHLKGWIATIKHKLETGDWLPRTVNINRDNVLAEYLCNTSSPLYETCPMCDQPSVGPCLIHR